MRTLIKNATIVNEGKSFIGSILIKEDKIHGIFEGLMMNDFIFENVEIIDANGMLLVPGVIDDQVHFREPGLTHKADIANESRAAVAGGITSFMEMPNTNPQTTTIAALDDKFQRAAKSSLANYSFYMGATNNNIDEVIKTDHGKVCGVKVFMGSSTGNMLVDKEKALTKIFTNSPAIVATHCEDEQTIQENSATYKKKYGEDVPISAHPLIRSTKACYRSSSKAVELAKKHNTKLHILHVSTEKELSLFEKGDIANKRITAEVCVHHLWFTDENYEKYGTKIKWNPAIKSKTDRDALRQAVINDKIDIIATDHAPHTLQEKENSYFKAPSGGPLVQHALVAMIELCHQKVFTIEKVVEKMCHAPAKLFNIDKRGFIREGYYADLTLIKNEKWTVTKNNILYKCGWSPFEGTEFSNKIATTFVNGNKVYDNGKINDSTKGKALIFNR